MENEISKSKRGRPRKNNNLNKTEITKMLINKQDEIVLFLPIPLNDNNNNITLSNKTDKFINEQDNIIIEQPINQKNIDKIEIININNNLHNEINISCWWCTYEIEKNNYYHIPDRYDDLTYYVYGYFCSPNCAMAFNLDEDDYKSTIRNALIEKLYEHNLRPADDWKLLQKFGGNMLIEDFRKNFNNNKSSKKIKLIYSV